MSDGEVQVQNIRFLISAQDEAPAVELEVVASSGILSQDGLASFRV
jgi:hypothetical protein